MRSSQFPSVMGPRGFEAITKADALARCLAAATAAQDGPGAFMPDHAAVVARMIVDEIGEAMEAHCARA